MRSGLYVVFHCAVAAPLLVALGGCTNADMGTRGSADARVGASSITADSAADREAASPSSMRGDIEAGTLLGCMEADAVFTVRLESSDFKTQFLPCATDAECTEWWPRFECADNGALISGCSGPVALAQKASATQWLQDTAEDLCPRIEPGCRAWGDCLPREPRCVQERCVLQTK